MKVGDLVRLTGDGVIAAWYPGINHNSAGIIIKLTKAEELIGDLLLDHDVGTEIATVEWPRGRDTHVPQDLEIINKYF